jgi:hypothetical protein
LLEFMPLSKALQQKFPHNPLCMHVHGYNLLAKRSPCQSEVCAVLVTQPIDELKKRFNPEAAKNVSASYILQITGNGGGTWLAKIDSGNLDLEPFKGTSTDAADCTISVSSEDLQMIMSGKMSAMTAALSGILSVDGSLGLAMQLVPIFFEGQQPNLF